MNMWRACQNTYHCLPLCDCLCRSGTGFSSMVWMDRECWECTCRCRDLECKLRGEKVRPEHNSPRNLPFKESTLISGVFSQAVLYLWCVFSYFADSGDHSTVCCRTACNTVYM